MPAKPKSLTEVQFLALLDKVLAKITSDLNLRSAIQDEVAKEIRIINKLASLTKFAANASVPDAAPQTLADLQDQLAATFGDDATVAVTAADENDGNLAVEVTLPDRTVSSQIKVQPGGPGLGEDDAPEVPFVPFPVALPQDPELVWAFARRENLGPDEAARALASIEQEFWASKGGQQRLRKGGERTFAEFVENVPSAALLESGMKRHYKSAEKIHALRPLEAGIVAPAAKPKRAAAPAKTSLDHLFAPPDESKESADSRPPRGAKAAGDDDEEPPSWD